MSKGLTFNVICADTMLRVVLSCTTDVLADTVHRNLTIAGKHGGKIYFSKDVQLSDNQYLIKIPLSLLPEGIATLTVFDYQGRPNCERLVYIIITINRRV